MAQLSASIILDDQMLIDYFDDEVLELCCINNIMMGMDFFALCDDSGIKLPFNRSTCLEFSNTDQVGLVKHLDTKSQIKFDVQVKLSHIPRTKQFIVTFYSEVNDARTLSDQERSHIKQVLDNLPEFLLWKNRDSVFLGCNNNFAQSAGLPNPEAIIGLTDYDLPWSQEESDAYRADDKEVMDSGNAKLNIEEPQTTKDGKKITLLTSKVPLYADDGEVVGIIGVYSDITELKNTQLNLEKEKQRAETASMAKTEFLANMSHDIKTPLSGVIGLAEILASRLEGENHILASEIKKSGESLMKFFNSCLELSSKEITDITSISSPLHIGKLINEIETLFSSSIIKNNIIFSVRYHEDIPNDLLGSYEAIYRVLLNIIGNAIKFTKEGSVKVSIDHEAQDDPNKLMLKIDVEDTGIGIAEEDVDKIFEKFVRLEPSYKGTFEGSGVGLYVVKQCVDVMGGSISVESSLGKGSKFSISIPVKIGSQDENSIEPSSSKQFRNQISNHKPFTANILFVEDNPVAQMIGETIFKQLSCCVDKAANGAEAIEKYEVDKYDLILMDIGLPDREGYEVAREIRAKEVGSKKTPIVAVTAHAAVDIEQYCQNAGMDGVLIKPLSENQAEQCLEHFVRQLSVTIDGITLL